MRGKYKPKKENLNKLLIYLNDNHMVINQNKERVVNRAKDEKKLVEVPKIKKSKKAKK